MTNPKRLSIDASAAPDLTALLAEVERGVTVTLTRDGVPIAVVGPPSGDGGAEPAVVARETPATYSSGGESPAQPATAMLRLIGGVGARSVLGVFVREPQRATHQREIARRAGVGLRSAQLALERLESLGLIISERDGNRRYYRANRNERFEELRALLAPEFGLTDAILRALRPLDDRVERAFIFGSAAAGSDTVDSDVDLLVVGEVSRDELVVPIAEAQRELGREIDLVLYRSDDFRRKREMGNHYVTATLCGPRVDVIGGPDDA